MTSFSGDVTEHSEESISLLIPGVFDGSSRDKMFSPTKTIGGFPWVLSVYRSSAHKSSIFITLKCPMKEGSNGWKCLSNLRIRIENPHDSFISHSVYMSDIRFDKDTHFFKEIHGETLLRANLFDEDPAVVTVWITVKEESRFRAREVQTFDFFSPSKISDVVLIVEGKKLHVSRQILALRSAFFETLFYGDFKESMNSEININDVKLEEFLVIANLIYGCDQEITGDNVEIVLKMADRFDVKGILEKAEDFLRRQATKDVKNVLCLADQYGMNSLRDDCIKKVTSPEMVRDLKNSTNYSNLSEKTKDELFNKVITMAIDLKNSPKNPRKKISRGDSYSSSSYSSHYSNHRY
ncbi:hypothetical protein PFISCL1PPCAC_20272 [Pristionchus fissidentatus]|uniref:BTB domain-containing protein n=1 Tax=Pristionchus fissidentatus TaxID=1538716 RepID=A0AAV5WEB5_9BILA|nr:hypothetical protein PFISCL1PPCAC_20272 [Pristionchus fissidentatus]